MTRHPRVLCTVGMLNGMLVLITAVSGPATLTAKKIPYNDEYSMETLALKGPEATDVYATFNTTDFEGYPIPAELKKLQVKIKDGEGEVAFIQNAWDVAVRDNVATMSAGDPAPHQTLYVQAHIKTGKREVVLKDQAIVLLRPDLVIDSVAATNEVVVDEHFLVKAYIREANLEVGTTATVSLFIDGEFLTSITDVEIEPGELVTFAFAGISISDPGTHELRIVISDADPAEYDDTNNEASVSIDVIQNLQTSSYSIQYTNYLNYYYYYSYRSCWGLSSNSTRETGSWDDLYLHGSSFGLVPNAPIETISWTVESENGVWNTGDRSDVVPISVTEDWDYYSIFDEETRTLLSVSVSKLTGWTNFEFSQFSGSRLVIQRSCSWWSGCTQTKDYTSTDGFMDAREFVKVSLLIDDDAVTIGGTATAGLGAMQHYSDSYDITGGGLICQWRRTLTHSYSTVTGYSSGTMDPAALGKSIPAVASIEEVPLPESVSLNGNYPNPFNPITSLRFALPEGAPVSLVIYDLVGREVARLVDGYVEAGHHEVVWNGRNASGSAAPTGVYLAHMTTPGYSRTLKMVMMK